MSTFVAGLDLGQTNDPSALEILERRDGPPARYDVRHVERFPLGTSYPAIVQAVKARLELVPESPQLVVDGTGVGRAVVDMFREAMPRAVVPVTIHGGERATYNRDDGYLHVPKRDLVGVVQVLLQNARLRLAKGLPEVGVLTAELRNFKVKLTEAANDVYGAWREGQHDDLVLALAVAAWYAEVGILLLPQPGVLLFGAAKGGWGLGRSPGA
jgi:hypothetical protein